MNGLATNNIAANEIKSLKVFSRCIFVLNSINTDKIGAKLFDKRNVTGMLQPGDLISHLKIQKPTVLITII